MLQKIAKLYVDIGFGFNEKQAITHIIIGDETRLEFDLSSYSGIKALRFDPVNDYSILHINSMEIFEDDNSSYELEDFQSNAFHQEGNNFVFTTKDPQIYLDLTENKIKKIIINLEYVAIGNDSFEYLLKYKDEFIMDQARQIQAKEVKINQFRKKIESLHIQLEDERKSHDAMLNSRSWKLTAPLRCMNVNPRTLKRKLKTAFYLLLNREYRTIEKSGLFDTKYYLSKNNEVKELDANPLVHYIASGAKERRDPNPLFDTSYYLDENPDVAESGMNPLAHYIKLGFKEGRDPNPLFDTSYYLDQNADVVESGMNPLLHYLSIGFKEGRDPNPLFDTSYYLDENPDVAESEMNPLEHYIKIGFKDGINPNPFFNTSYYLDRNRDVVRSKMNPLAHYFWVGAKEGRRPNMLDTPKISIITPVYNIDDIFLNKCIWSVLNQIYNNWELCLVDDGSTKSHIKAILEKYAEDDPRIKVKFLKENQGISAALNEGVSLATGGYLAFMDHDDELTNDALYEVFKVIDGYDPDIIYSDESIVDSEGKEIAAHYKPDISPDLLLSHNYITHLLVVKDTLFHEIGGFSSKYDGAQDYDFVLKLNEKTNKIYHISKVLYHWRTADTSTSADPEVKDYADDAGKLALDAVLDRQKIKGSVLKANQRFFYRVKRDLLTHPLLSIIIPFKDEPDYLKSCIQAILYKTKYQNFEIIGINNNSKRSETFSVMNNFLEVDNRIKFYDYDIPFNYSKINNYAVGVADGEHIVLMNSDIEIINFDWLESLLEHSQREDVGAVGAKLYYSNNTIQHAGVIIGISGFAGHSHRCFPRQAQGYYNRLMCIQNISAVSGALLMVKKRLYEEIGGLDETNLSIALNDVDFCLRLRDRGYLNIFTPYCEAIHYESTSRGYEEIPERKVRFLKEIKYFQKKWKDLLDRGDPYYNPNLTLSKEDFSLRENGFYTSEC